MSMSPEEEFQYTKRVEAERQAGRLNDVIRSQQDELRYLREQRDKDVESLNSFKKEVERLHALQNMASRNSWRMDEENKRLTNNAAHLQEMLDRATKELASRARNPSVDGLNQEIKLRDTTIARLQWSLKRTQESVSVENQRLSEALTTKKRQYDELHEEVLRLRTECAKLRAEGLAYDAPNVARENKTLKGQLRVATEQCDSVKRRLAKLEEDHRVEVTGWSRKTYKDMARRIDRVEQERDQLIIDKQQLAKENHELVEKLKNRPVLSRLPVLPGFEELGVVLDAALAQAQSGKGKQRHGSSGARWTDQKIHGIPDMQGHDGGLVYQICKKAAEAEHMDDRARYHEALGVIVYAAALAYRAQMKVRLAGTWVVTSTEQRPDGSENVYVQYVRDLKEPSDAAKQAVVGTP